MEEEQTIVVVEFARGLSEKASDMDSKAQAKKNNYHSTILFLKRLFPTWTVLLHTYIMGILTTFQQQVWDAQLQAAGLTFSQNRSVQLACVKECVMAGHRLLNARRSRLEGMRMRGQQIMPLKGALGVDPIPRTGVG